MLISPAFAQDGGALGGLGGLLPIVLIFVVFYFLLIRPQQKKAKDHRAMVAAVRRGDKVVTGGGLIGVVTKVVSDTEVQIELAQGVKVRVIKATLSDVIAKTAPAKDKTRRPGGKAANDDAAQRPAAGFGFSLSKLLGLGDKPK